ncbi:MAG: tRNA pseudouridine(38-40) synthase TruA [Calditrichaceae bacterium]
MHRIKLTIEYDGTAYCGWQFQKKQVSIQEEIERALSIIFKLDIRIIGAGRTDTGVHARNQIAHLNIPEYDLDKLKQSLNGLLKQDIRIKDVQACAADFHARFDAKERRYRYHICQQPTAIHRAFAWQVYFPVNIALMQEGADVIAGTKDFKSFCKVKSNVKNHLCQIFKSHWLIRDDLLVYEIAANRFLHGMVRAIVGILIDLGRGRIDIKLLKHIINSKDRTQVLNIAPAHGLFLEKIVY